MQDILQPTLLIDEKIVKRNISRMVDKANKNGVELTPHFKTHQSKKVGKWFREQGIKSITVSSVSMAEYFADDDWQHITIAFPVNILQVKQIADLAAKVELTLLVTDIEQVILLINEVALYLNILLEVDNGTGRSGIIVSDTKKISTIIEKLSASQHHFKGFYSHFGNTYSADSSEAVKAIYHESLHKLNDLAIRFSYVQPKISLGDTPSCSLIEEFVGVESIHAGNFVFYDLTQVQIGACKVEDIAIALACPVVSKISDRQEVIIYGGGVHLSKEGLYDNRLKTNIFGRLVYFNETGWSTPLTGCYIRSISQEHGVVKLNEESFQKISVGDIIGVLPVHSCMTADAMGGYKQLTGEPVDHFKSIWANH